MPRFGYGRSVMQGRKIPVVASGSAPATLPLSTATFRITQAVGGFFCAGQYTKDILNRWVFDNSGNDGNIYIVQYGFFGARWSLYYIDIDTNTGEISLNSYAPTAIPLTGWTPAVTIITP